MVEFNEVNETAFGLTVREIKKSVLSVIENRFVRKTAADGSFDFGSFLGNREIEITFQDKTSETKTELYNNMLLVAAWLYPLDKLSKKLQITGDECGEDGKYYIAKVDGSTDLEEILEYGIFTVLFVATDPYKKANDQNFIAGASFDRNSIAYNDTQLVAANQPRFVLIDTSYGIMIEEGVTNFVFNPLFTNPAANIPQFYGASVLSSTGTHLTSAGEYTATMLTSAANGAFFGIKEPGGAQHLIAFTTDVIAASVYAQVVTGPALAQISLYYLNTGFAPLPTLTLQTSSASRIRFVFENNNQATQRVIGIGLEAYATTSGDTGVVTFSKPMLEVNNTGGYAHTFQDNSVPRLDEDVLVALGPGFYPAKPFYLAITLYPNWASNDLEGNAYDRSALILYRDANNNAGINWNFALEQWEAYININGVTTTAIAPAQPHLEADQIKLYMLREDTQFKLLLKVNAAATVDSGFSADTRANPDFTTLFIGSRNSASYINSVVKNVIFNDTDPDPDPLEYI